MLRRISGFILLCGAAATCQAYENFGPYVGIGAGRAEAAADFALDETTSLRIDGDDTGLRVFAGYRFSPYFAVEVSYADLGDFSGTEAGDRLTIGYRGVTPWLVGSLPLGRFELLGRVGLFINATEYEFTTPDGTLSGNESNNSLALGAGAGVMLTRHLNLRLEYEFMDLDEVDDSSALWLSLAWRFL